MHEPWDLTRTNSHRLSRHDYEVAVLPIGATEVHNRHLPLGQDVLHTAHVAREACRAAWAKRPGVICLPAIPYGVDCNLMDFPLTVHVSMASLEAIVRDVIASMRHHGIRKIVLVNGHGGNNFTNFVREIQCAMDVHVFLCDWWTVGHDRYHEIFDAADDHGGEMETSIALALYPELVDLDAAGDATPRPFGFEALEKGWVKTSRNFGRMTENCAVGDPAKASAEKGRQYLDLVVQRIGDFLAELAEAPIDEHFPHVP